MSIGNPVFKSGSSNLISFFQNFDNSTQNKNILLRRQGPQRCKLEKCLITTEGLSDIEAARWLEF